MKERETECVCICLYSWYVYICPDSYVYLFSPLCNCKFINIHATESNAGQGELCLKGCTQQAGGVRGAWRSASWAHLDSWKVTWCGSPGTPSTLGGTPLLSAAAHVGEDGQGGFWHPESGKCPFLLLILADTRNLQPVFRQSSLGTFPNYYHYAWCFSAN